jgi:hypothetical protein
MPPLPMRSSAQGKGRRPINGFIFQFLVGRAPRLPQFAVASPRGEVGKKKPPFPAAFEVDNREASNRVDRSHSVSKEDAESHKRESLIDRKRANFFRLCLPCRPLAERGLPPRHRLSSPRKQGPMTTGPSN